MRFETFALCVIAALVGAALYLPEGTHFDISSFFTDSSDSSKSTSRVEDNSKLGGPTWTASKQFNAYDAYSSSSGSSPYGTPIVSRVNSSYDPNSSSYGYGSSTISGGTVIVSPTSSVNSSGVRAGSGGTQGTIPIQRMRQR